MLKRRSAQCILQVNFSAATIKNMRKTPVLHSRYHISEFCRFPERNETKAKSEKEKTYFTFNVSQWNQNFSQVILGCFFYTLRNKGSKLWVSAPLVTEVGPSRVHLRTFSQGT
uniref:Uncharacterized protein n=1 Tax=Pygocentrus nattereri TaxID=42514 RepID=A0AAR2IXU5_PYGNA